MFDTTNEITIHGLRTTQGQVPITVRWPTDDEWAAHRRRRKLIRHELGRGASENEIDNAEGDIKLWEVIHTNGAPPLTGAEASQVIDTLARCEVTGVDLGANEAEVRMLTAWGTVKHVLRIPTYEEVRKLERTTRMISMPYGRFQIHSYLEPGAALWDQCDGKGEAYSAAVPNLHKDTAVRAVVEAIKAEVAPQHDEENFS